MFTKDEENCFFAVDIAKMFFAICIVFLHSGAYHLLPGEWYVLHCVLRLAVPFFFVITGYMWGIGIYQKKRNQREALIRFEKRMLYPYLVFSFANIVVEVLKMYLDGEQPLWIFLKVCRSIIFYPYGALWYIWACMVAVPFLYIFIKYNKVRDALFAGILLYVAALLMNSYYFLIEETPIQRVVDLYLKIATSPRNGIFFGFMFIGIGVWLGKHHDQIISRKWKGRSLILGGISYCFLIGETFFIHNKTMADDHSLFISFLVLIPSLVVVLLNCNIVLKKTVSYELRYISSGTYYLHRFLLSVLNIFYFYIGITMNKMFDFILILFVCIGVCCWLNKNKTEPFYSLLK